MYHFIYADVTSSDAVSGLSVVIKAMQIHHVVMRIPAAVILFLSTLVVGMYEYGFVTSLHRKPTSVVEMSH